MLPYVMLIITAKRQQIPTLDIRVYDRARDTVLASSSTAVFQTGRCVNLEGAIKQQRRGSSQQASITSIDYLLSNTEVLGKGILILFFIKLGPIC